MMVCILLCQSILYLDGMHFCYAKVYYTYDGTYFAMPRCIILMMVHILLCQGILYL